VELQACCSCCGEISVYIVGMSLLSCRDSPQSLRKSDVHDHIYLSTLLACRRRYWTSPLLPTYAGSLAVGRQIASSVQDSRPFRRCVMPISPRAKNFRRRGVPSYLSAARHRACTSAANAAGCPTSSLDGFSYQSQSLRPTWQFWMEDQLTSITA
jgi:hypothetical protein